MVNVEKGPKHTADVQSVLGSQNRAIGIATGYGVTTEGLEFEFQ
jgi:hypothetical protein